MSAIANPRPSSRLTRAERMAAYSATRIAPAPLYKIGDAVTFDARAGRVIDAPRPGIVTVRTYAGEFTMHETHPDLVAG